MTSLSDLELTPEEGVLYRKRLGNRAGDIVPLTFGQAALKVGKAGWDCYDDVYSYESIAAAVESLLAWSGEGDPAGWHRHQPSGRRRPHGDPAREYVWA